MNDAIKYDAKDQQHVQDVHLPHTIIVKAPGLLPMRYTLRELAEELGCSDRTLRTWSNAGMPVERDARGHLWVIGTAFALWVMTKHKQTATKVTMPGTGYCMKCRTSVIILDPVDCINGKHVRLRGVCPNCGTTVYRGIKSG